MIFAHQRHGKLDVIQDENFQTEGYFNMSTVNLTVILNNKETVP